MWTVKLILWPTQEDNAWCYSYYVIKCLDQPFYIEWNLYFIYIVNVIPFPHSPPRKPPFPSSLILLNNPPTLTSLNWHSPTWGIKPSQDHEIYIYFIFKVIFILFQLARPIWIFHIMLTLLLFLNKTWTVIWNWSHIKIKFQCAFESPGFQKNILDKEVLESLMFKGSF